MTTLDYDVVRAYARTAAEISAEATTSVEIEAAYGRLVYRAEAIIMDRPCLTASIEAVLGEAAYGLMQAAREAGYQYLVTAPEAPNPWYAVAQLISEDPRVQRINPLCTIKPAAPADDIPEEA